MGCNSRPGLSELVVPWGLVGKFSLSTQARGQVMYLSRNEIVARPGGANALEDFVTSLGEMRKGQPGYQGQTLLRSYAYPGKYALMSRWENLEAAWDFSKSAALSDLIKGPRE